MRSIKIYYNLHTFPIYQTKSQSKLIITPVGIKTSFNEPNTLGPRITRF